MSRKGKGKVPPTLEEPEQEQVTINAPVEIFYHIAATNVTKLPNGAIEFSLISPTGMATTVLLSEDNVKELIENLKNTISTVDVFSTLPSGLAS